MFPYAVSDSAAVDACLRSLDDQRVLAEPACGAALVLLYQQPTFLRDYHNILVIVCGGSTASRSSLEAFHG